MIIRESCPHQKAKAHIQSFDKEEVIWTIFIYNYQPAIY